MVATLAWHWGDWAFASALLASLLGANPAWFFLSKTNRAEWSLARQWSLAPSSGQPGQGLSVAALGARRELLRAVATHFALHAMLLSFAIWAASARAPLEVWGYALAAGLVCALNQQAVLSRLRLGELARAIQGQGEQQLQEARRRALSAEQARQIESVLPAVVPIPEPSKTRRL